MGLRGLPMSSLAQKKYCFSRNIISYENSILSGVEHSLLPARRSFGQTKPPSQVFWGGWLFVEVSGYSVFLWVPVRTESVFFQFHECFIPAECAQLGFKSRPLLLVERESLRRQ